MTIINGLPYCELHFKSDGTLDTSAGQEEAMLTSALSSGSVTDLFVLSHGWNNGVTSARNLYRAMFALLAEQLDNRKSTSVAVGIIWPSLLFPDDDPDADPTVAL